MNRVRTLAATCGAVAMLVSALPALADPPPWAPAHGYRDRHYGRDDYAPGAIVAQPPPAVVVAPAPIYVAPPPPAVVYQPAPVVAPAPSLDIVVPLHFGH